MIVLSMIRRPQQKSNSGRVGRPHNGVRQADGPARNPPPHGHFQDFAAQVRGDALEALAAYETEAAVR